MISKYLPPKRLLHSKQFAEMCDFTFMRTDAPAWSYLKPSNMEDIRSDCTVYCWTDRINELFSHLYKNLSTIKNVCVISGDNDHSCNPNGSVVGWPQYPNYGLLPCPSNVTKWYAQNAETDNELMTPFSIGVAKYCTDSSTNPHKTYEPTVDVYRHFMQDCTRDKLLYCNYHVPNNPHQRGWVDTIVSTTCPVATFVKGSIPQPLYFKNLQEHLFVLCPPGNGKDTHRTWESLYFGAIPIVEDSLMNRHFANLFPILVVKTWFDITPKFLREKYDELNSKGWRYDLLDAENYFDHYGIRKSSVEKP